MKYLQIVLKFLAMSSDVGIGLLLLNTLVMAWYAILNKQPFPDGYVMIVGIIFGGKTAYSFSKKGKANE